MGVQIKKWGNSASIRIPAAVLAAVRLKIDDAVIVREEKGRIVIEPERPGEVDLAALVEAITDDNRHGPVDWGAPAGREAW